MSENFFFFSQLFNSALVGLMHITINTRCSADKKCLQYQGQPADGSMTPLNKALPFLSGSDQGDGKWFFPRQGYQAVDVSFVSAPLTD